LSFRRCPSWVERFGVEEAHAAVSSTGGNGARRVVDADLRRRDDECACSAPAKQFEISYAAIPSTGASGGRPRIMSDAFSAIIIVEE